MAFVATFAMFKCVFLSCLNAALSFPSISSLSPFKVSLSRAFMASRWAWKISWILNSERKAMTLAPIRQFTGAKNTLYVKEKNQWHWSAVTSVKDVKKTSSPTGIDCVPLLNVVHTAVKFRRVCAQMALVHTGKWFFRQKSILEMGFGWQIYPQKLQFPSPNFSLT